MFLVVVAGVVPVWWCGVLQPAYLQRTEMQSTPGCPILGVEVRNVLWYADSLLRWGDGIIPACWRMAMANKAEMPDPNGKILMSEIENTYRLLCFITHTIQNYYDIRWSFHTTQKHDFTCEKAKKEKTQPRADCTPRPNRAELERLFDTTGVENGPCCHGNNDGTMFPVKK